MARGILIINQRQFLVEASNLYQERSLPLSDLDDQRRFPSPFNRGYCTITWDPEQSHDIQIEIENHRTAIQDINRTTNHSISITSQSMRITGWVSLYEIMQSGGYAEIECDDISEIPMSEWTYILRQYPILGDEYPIPPGYRLPEGTPKFTPDPDPEPTEPPDIRTDEEQLIDRISDELGLESQ